MTAGGGRTSRSLLVMGPLLCLLAFSFVNTAQAQTPAQAQVTTTLVVTPTFDAFGGGSATVIGVINATSPSSGNHTVFTTFKPVVTGRASLPGGGSQTVTCTPVRLQTGGYDCSFSFPAGGLSLTLSVEGTVQGSSFLWRYLTGTAVIYLTDMSAVYSTSVVVPRGTLLSRVYYAGGGAAPLPPSTTNGSEVVYDMGSSSGLNFAAVPGLLVFQSTSFVPASIAITSAALAVIALAALDFFRTGERLLGDVYQLLKGASGRVLASVRWPGGSGRFRFRRLLQPRKLLALFLICAFLMVALGALSGPDPRLKAYVMSGSSQETGSITSELQAASGNPNVLVITPAQDYADFNVMSSVGQFNVAVISAQFPAAQMAEDSGFILPNLGNVPVIVVDSNSSLAAPIKALYPNAQVLIVQHVSNLTSGQSAQLALFLALSQKSNAFGLHLGVREFKAVLASEAVLSMVLILLGWAYLGSLTVDARRSSDVSHLAMVIAAGTFVFVFSEAVYVATSAVLTVPLSLHAVTSDAHDITAIGLLGFGGGSTPRLAAGFLGFVIGAAGAVGGLQVRKRDFALVTALVLFLFANPLVIGQFIFETILLFLPISNLAFGSAYSSSLSLKGFIYGVGLALGGNVSPGYLLSAGTLLYFAGLVPLAFIKKMGQTTTVVALLLVAFIVGDGGVRVGQMTPLGTVIAIVPGIFIGFAFTAVLLAFALVERFLRENWRSRV